MATTDPRLTGKILSTNSKTELQNNLPVLQMLLIVIGRLGSALYLIARIAARHIERF
ncbi:MAG: hypothetical protein ACI9CE_002295 [Flavobacterium sp.]|jgi:hypothetical protein